MHICRKKPVEKVINMYHGKINNRVDQTQFYTAEKTTSKLHCMEQKYSFFYPYLENIYCAINYVDVTVQSSNLTHPIKI